MIFNNSQRLPIQVNKLIFPLLLMFFTILIAWLSTEYRLKSDWTINNANSLSQTSKTILKSMHGTIQVTAYARPNKILWNKIRSLIGRYSNNKPDVKLRFVNPDLDPKLSKTLGLRVDGELIIEYEERSETIRTLTESDVTRALQHLAHPDGRWVLFLTGHGERSPVGQKNHDYGRFGAQLEKYGINPLELNLVTTQSIPDNIRCLVLSGAKFDLFEGEIKIIQDYISNGGNLFWLQSPDRLHGLETIALHLGIQFLPGVIVDKTSKLHGVKDPSFVTIGDYPIHSITQGFKSITLFPKTSAIDSALATNFQSDPILRTSNQSWSETGPIRGQIQFDENSRETPGPLTIGLALTPITTEKTINNQRIIIIGNEDFLANTYIGNGGNLDLGINIIQWLINDNESITLSRKPSSDKKLALSGTQIGFMAIAYLIIIPTLLIGTGLVISYRRRSL